MVAPASDPPMDEGDSTNDFRVLIVDDEADFRTVVAKRLGHRGLAALDADGGESALRMLATHPIEVIVLDVKMPGMGGIETLRKIKERHPETEVILLTGHANTQGGVEGIKSGAFDYLAKPIEIEQLHRKIVQAHDKIRWREAEKKERAFRERVKQQMVVAERLAALGTMATGVAHEINNPLAIVQESAGWLQQILGKPEMADMPRRADFEKALEQIRKAVHRARRITQQLLQVVKAQTTEMPDPKDLAEVDLKGLVLECLSLVEKQADLKQITITLESPEPAPMAWTDPLPLLQVLINLVTNAIHATNPGGRITVSLRAALEQVQIAVRDTGCGIPEEDIDKIFEPFFTTKAVGQGTGMGLYVSWGIVSQLGGLIAVESEVGKGTTFTINLPIKH